MAAAICPAASSKKSPVIVVERQTRADAGDQKPGGQLLSSGSGERQHQSALRPIVGPRARGQTPKPLFGVFYDLALMGLEDETEAPNVVLAFNANRYGARFRSGREMDRLTEACLPAVFVEQIDQREGKIVLVFGERGGGGVTGLFGGFRFRETAFAEVPQSLQAPLADDALGALAAHDEDATDAARLVAHGLV